MKRAWLVGLVAMTGCAKGSSPLPVEKPVLATDVPTEGPRSFKATDVVKTSKGDIDVTPIHHATMLLSFAGKNFYLDPTKDSSFEGMPKADVIVITDIHGDHLDPAGISAIRKADTAIVAPPAVAEKLADAGVAITVIKNGESREVAGVGVEAVPMYNLKRGPSEGKLFHDKGRGNGYVFTFDDKRIYVSGDTECTPEMRALKKIDVAFVCMNLPYTMPPEEAAECVRDFRPKVAIPYHHRGSNLDAFKSAIPADAGVEVRIRPWY